MNWKTAVDIGAILAPVQPGLQLVEAKMKTVESSLFTPLATAFVDLIGSGGKRLRPAVALMAARFNGELDGAQYEQVISLAASVEMLHTATLVHDDVIDGALLRRGAPTLNATWNRGATVLAGNYMFARAAHFAAETGNPRVIRIFSDTLEIIVEGELRQLRARHQFRQQKDEYYQRIYAKTASLFSAAAEAAATLSGLDEDGIGSLRDYGHNLGMAFQIVDDILDFTGNAGSLGKPAGSDLLQGTLTLPFFYYLQIAPRSQDLLDQLETLYSGDLNSDDASWTQTVAEVVQDLRSGPAIEAARQEASVFLERAASSLAALPDNRYKQAMLDLCDFVVQRTY
jgi:geranylgeranyl pyrophosphate synthase